MQYKSIKNTKLQLLFIMLLMLSSSCSQKNTEAPEGIIPADKMEKILTDMHLADAISSQNFPAKGGADSIVWKTKSFTKLILHKYHTDTAVFNRSFRYYVQRPEEMDSIYSRMVTTLTRLQTKLTPVKKVVKPVVPVKQGSASSAGIHGVPATASGIDAHQKMIDAQMKAAAIAAQSKTGSTVKPGPVFRPDALKGLKIATPGVIPALPGAKPATGVIPALPGAKPATGVKPALPGTKPAAGVKSALPGTKPAAGIKPVAKPVVKPAPVQDGANTI